MTENYRISDEAIEAAALALFGYREDVSHENYTPSEQDDLDATARRFWSDPSVVPESRKAELRADARRILCAAAGATQDG